VRDRVRGEGLTADERRQTPGLYEKGQGMVKLVVEVADEKIPRNY
jgi:hypothetical protein